MGGFVIIVISQQLLGLLLLILNYLHRFCTGYVYFSTVIICFYLKICASGRIILQCIDKKENIRIHAMIPAKNMLKILLKRAQFKTSIIEAKVMQMMMMMILLQ